MHYPFTLETDIDYCLNVAGYIRTCLSSGFWEMLSTVLLTLNVLY